MRTPWPHQERGVDLLRRCLSTNNPATGKRYRRPVLQIPTGGGKTFIASLIILSAISKGNRVVFTCPRISLINQTVQAFVDAGITDIGVIQADHPLTNPRAMVQVCSRQTLQRRGWPEADFVIVDECHDGPDFFLQWTTAHPEMIFVGLSATPWTKGLGKIFDCLLTIVTTQELIDAGFLSPFRLYAPSRPDLSKVATVAGDYNQGQLSDVMSKEPLVADVVQNWLEKGEDRPTFVFCVDRAHARHVEERFRFKGVSVDYIDANTPIAEREAIEKRFHNGDTRVVCSVGVLTMGIDWDVRCLILARPTKSEMLLVQIIGRALRTATGKDYALIFDHTGTSDRLGLVTDITFDHLDDGEPKGKSAAEPKEKLPVECPGCGILRPKTMNPCEVCGHRPEPKRQDYATVDGELVEVTAHKSLASGLGEQRMFMGELLSIAAERGYSAGWASHKFKEKFGDWPSPKVKYAPKAHVVRGSTYNWVKSRAIAYAKAKATANATRDIWSS